MTVTHTPDLGPLLVLVGPTAVGKTAYSIDLAKALHGEIISGDAFQVYRGMDIGTAKIKAHEMQGIPHHLIDICDPDQAYTAADFQKEAQEQIQAIQARGRLPMVVGGTGLYIDGLIYHYRFGSQSPDPQLRQRLSQRYDREGGEALLRDLAQRDPDSARGLFPKDRNRILRALEIVLSTGAPVPNPGHERASYQSRYQLCLIGLQMERQALYARINRRVDDMFDQGLLEEVQGLLDQGYPADSIAFKGIGYKELIAYLQGETSLEEAKDLIKRNSRRLAKRQGTWFRRDPHLHPFDIGQASYDDNIAGMLTLAQGLQGK